MEKKNIETPVFDWSVISEKKKNVTATKSDINTIWFS
jgi:hypothetical protein